MSSGRFLYLFVHLPKSAGTSINKHADKYFTSSEKLTISPKLLEVKRDQLQKILLQTKRYLETLPAIKKEKLGYVTGHHLPYGAHQQINKNKNPFYFTFLRDPIKRIVSLYNYYCQWYEQDKDEDKQNNELYQQIFLVNNQEPSFIDWYQQKYQPAKNNFPVPSSVAFYRQLGYLSKGKLTTKTARDCWQKFSFVGLVEHFADDAAFIYHQLEINKFFIKQNISQKYFNLSQHPQILKKLKKDLAPEYLLYQTAAKHRQEFIDQHPEYQLVVNQMKKKQRLITPFTQVLYDWPDNFHTISKNLRQYLPGYGVLFDRMKNGLSG